MCERWGKVPTTNTCEHEGGLGVPFTLLHFAASEGDAIIHTTSQARLWGGVTSHT